MSPLSLARAAADELAARTGITRLDIAVTLGSGWKSAIDHLGRPVAAIPAAEIPGFAASGVAGHSGLLTVVELASGEHALVIGARTHLYEGRGVDAVVHGVRTAAAAGAHTVVLTNGAGGLQPHWKPGQPVLIRDHINLTATSPITGAEFVDLTDLYTPRLREIAKDVAPDLEEGVYAQFPGPHYETPAEVAMVGRIGGTIVGMSTALEAIAARQAGLEVLGISLITNLAAGVQDQPLDHSEVLEAGRLAEPYLGPLLARIVSRLTEK
ncbi:purine-nucleoside phosphorylase [Saccharopolyspora shandongensis]|uniref:purine-nucleoside phosphorylase n=1 Tax=Saccharopolyspora shandongensis TaxID=418495 RepID=UPI00343FF49A